MTRYSELRPLFIEQRWQLATHAAYFFLPTVYKECCAIIGKTPEPNRILPFAIKDFLAYLDKIEFFPNGVGGHFPADKYQQLINQLLKEMAEANIFRDMGVQGGNVLNNRSYYRLQELTTLQSRDHLWLAPALGPQFLELRFRESVVQIAGVTKDEVESAGTGLVIAPRWVLTAAHVLTDMKVHDDQQFGGVACRVVRHLVVSTPEWKKRLYPDDATAGPDVGLLEVDVDLAPMPGLAFRDPQLLETVYTLGYPLVPQARESFLVMQRGEVSTTQMTDSGNQQLFLYSAISRPGNSGGPILSADGYVVGLVAQEKTQPVVARYDTELKLTAPYYAGVPTNEIVKAVRELVPGLTLPVEDYQ